MKKAVIFDLDGTLLDTLEDLYLTINEVLEVYDFPKRSRTQVKSFLGNGVYYLIKSALPDAATEKQITQTLALFQEKYPQQMMKNTKPFDGIMTLLQKLQESGYKTAILSNKYDAATKKLSRDIFGTYIDIAVGEQSDIKRKPAPDGVHLLLQKLDVLSENAVLVGDGEADILAAKNAGIKSIAVSWGFRSQSQLQDVGAGIFVHTVKELEDLLLNNL